MSANENFVSLVGRICKDPEIRFGKETGTPVLSLRLAQNQRKLVNDVWEDGETWYYDAVAFGKIAEKGAELAIGTAVRVTGRLQMDSWETPEGEKRSKLKIVASTLEASLNQVKQVEGARGHLALSWGGNAGPAPADNGIERSLYEENDSF